MYGSGVVSAPLDSACGAMNNAYIPDGQTLDIWNQYLCNTHAGNDALNFYGGWDNFARAYVYTRNCVSETNGQTYACQAIQLEQ